MKPIIVCCPEKWELQSYCVICGVMFSTHEETDNHIKNCHPQEVDWHKVSEDKYLDGTDKKDLRR